MFKRKQAQVEDDVNYIKRFQESLLRKVIELNGTVATVTTDVDQRAGDFLANEHDRMLKALYERGEQVKRNHARALSNLKMKIKSSTMYK